MGILEVRQFLLTIKTADYLQVPLIHHLSEQINTSCSHPNYVIRRDDLKSIRRLVESLITDDIQFIPLYDFIQL